MTFWDKSLRIFKSLRDNTPQSVRQLARHTGLSKSSVQRLQQAMERRNRHPESGLWETEAGRQWLRRLVVATLYVFGLTRGVGMDTISAFFARLHLDTQLGCSPSALRSMLEAIETALLETATSWEQEGCAGEERREVIGAVDETFLEQMMLVCMDLPTGYLVLEAVAADRTYPTWKALVEERLTALKADVRYLVSDRAKALIELAEHGFACLSMPDFFHCMHDLVKGYSRAIAQRVHQAQHALHKAQEQQRRSLGAEGVVLQEVPQLQQPLEEVQHWEQVRQTYQHHLETLSLTLHPFCIADSTAQTSAQVHRQLSAAVDAIATLAQSQQLPARPAIQTKVRTQLPGLAALVDTWWTGVEQDLEHAAISAPWRQWAKTYLLPAVYWEHHVTHTRCARRKAKLRQASESVQAALQSHECTRQLPAPALDEWHAWATRQVAAFQRTSSAVEGRNGVLAQLHHNQRGLPKRRYKVWTVLHNFDCRAADGTTPAARFFRRAFPDLFETVLSNIEALPRPRQRNHAMARTG